MKSLLRVTLNLFILFSSSLLLSQCDRTDVSVPQNEGSPYTVSSKQAMEVAQRYVANLQKRDSKSGARTSSESDVINEKIVLDDNDKKPLFRILNRKKGFIIVSADLRTMPVLAYSDESQFETDKMPFGVKDWYETAKQKIKDVKNLNVSPDSVIIKEWRKYLSGDLNLPPSKGAKLASTYCDEFYQYGYAMCQTSALTKGPLLNTSWGQDYLSSTSLTWASTSCGPCARFSAGCGPVAMAQIWEYYRPNSALPRTSYYSCTASTGGEYALGQLMLACGNAASSQYHAFGTCNTFTWPSDVRSGLSSLGFSNGGSNGVGYNYNTIRNELLGDHPLIFWGSTCLTCFDNYHIWVADGIQETNFNEFSCETLSCTNTWSTSYIHMNWGWDGSYNGWYAFQQYNPGGTDYTGNLNIISGIRS
jgi:hypothetical protein